MQSLASVHSRLIVSNDTSYFLKLNESLRSFFISVQYNSLYIFILRISLVYHCLSHCLHMKLESMVHLQLWLACFCHFMVLFS